jgi:hypothetical protein
MTKIVRRRTEYLPTSPVSCHVVIVVTAVTTISLPPVNNIDIYLALTAWYVNHFNELCKFKEVS